MKVALMALVLLLLSVANASAVETGLPSAVVPGGLGVEYHYVGVGGDGPDTINMQASGVKFVRMDLSWNVVETTMGQYDFTDFDGFENACMSRGLRILWILDSNNPLYGTNPGLSSWRQGFTNFASAVAAHYKGDGNIYELWNEPNSGFWPGGSNVNQYMALANQALPAMRLADPNATIIGAATCPHSTGSSTGVDTTFLTSCFNYGQHHPGQKGLLDLVDAVSVHPYQSTAGDIYNNPGPPEGVVANTYTPLTALMKQYHSNVALPIVSSEWGYSTAMPGITAQVQGDYLARMMLVNLSQGIPLSIWYDWKNDGTDPADIEDNFGMVTNGLLQKPAYQEMRLLVSSLAGTTFHQQLNDGNSNDWLLVFQTPSGQQILAAWTTGDAHTVNVGGSWGSLNLTSTPFYVPELGTLTLLGDGLAGLAICAWLRKWKCQKVSEQNGRGRGEVQRKRTAVGAIPAA